MSTRFSGYLTIDPPLSAKAANGIKKIGRGEYLPSAPDSYCDFTVNDDGDRLIHSGAEKTRDYAEWIAYIVGTILGDQYVVSGTFEVDDTEYGVREDIVVKDSVVYVQDYELQKAALRKIA